MKRRPRAAPIRLSGVVQGVYPKAEPEELRGLRAFGWWDKAVPPRVAARARPVRLERGILTIHVETSAWAQELDMLRPHILAAVQRNAQDARVKTIRVRVGPVPKMPARPIEPTRPPIEPIAVTELPAEVGRALAGIADNELRSAVANAAAVALAPSPAPHAAPGRSQSKQVDARRQTARRPRASASPVRRRPQRGNK